MSKINKEKFPILSAVASVAETLAAFSEGNILIKETSDKSGVTYVFNKTIQEEQYVCLYNDPHEKFVKTLPLEKLNKELAIQQLIAKYPEISPAIIQQEVFICVIKAVI